MDDLEKTAEDKRERIPTEKGLAYSLDLKQTKGTIPSYEDLVQS